MRSEDPGIVDQLYTIALVLATQAREINPRNIPKVTVIKSSSFDERGDPVHEIRFVDSTLETGESVVLARVDAVVSEFLEGEISTGLEP